MLKLNIGANVMLTVNKDMQGRLLNRQTAVIKHSEFAESSVREVYIKFSDEQAGSKAMRSSYLGRRNSWVPIKKCETKISIKKGSASPSIKRTHFPLTLAWASTVQSLRSKFRTRCY